MLSLPELAPSPLFQMCWLELLPSILNTIAVAQGLANVLELVLVLSLLAGTVVLNQ